MLRSCTRHCSRILPIAAWGRARRRRAAKAPAGQIVVVARPVLEAPRTKVIVALLRRLPVAGRTLLVTAAPDAILARSASNLPHVTVRPATSLRIHEILTADCVVLTPPAVAVVAEVFGP